jgi:hypothetical protein
MLSQTMRVCKAIEMKTKLLIAMKHLAVQLSRTITIEMKTKLLIAMKPSGISFCCFRALLGLSVLKPISASFPWALPKATMFRAVGALDCGYSQTKKERPTRAAPCCSVVERAGCCF